MPYRLPDLLQRNRDWARAQSVVVNGWVYGLHNGLLEDLQMTVRDAAELTVACDRALTGLLARHGPAVGEN